MFTLEGGFEVSSITRQLKLKAKYGKYREIDVVDIEGMLKVLFLVKIQKYNGGQYYGIKSW